MQTLNPNTTIRISQPPSDRFISSRTASTELACHFETKAEILEEPTPIAQKDKTSTSNGINQGANSNCENTINTSQNEN